MNFLSAAGGAQHGFLWEDGVFITIDVPGARLTSALDIDNHGRIVGQYGDATGIFHGFLRDTSGAFTTIDVPGATSTVVFAINDRGQMLGTYGDTDGTLQAFLLDEGVVTSINFPGAVVTQPTGINNRGQIVGVYVDGGRPRGFLLSDGEFRRLTDPPGAFLQSLAWTSMTSDGSSASISEEGGNTMNSMFRSIRSTPAHAFLLNAWCELTTTG